MANGLCLPFILTSLVVAWMMFRYATMKINGDVWTKLWIVFYILAYILMLRDIYKWCEKGKYAYAWVVFIIMVAITAYGFERIGNINSKIKSWAINKWA